MRRDGYRVEIIVRNPDFSVIDRADFSGRAAIVDAMYYLDTKYDVSAYAVLKRFGIIEAGNPFNIIIKKLGGK